MEPLVNNVLIWLRSKRPYRTLAATWFFRRLVAGWPRKWKFRALKGLGTVPVRIRVGPVAFILLTSSDDDHYLSAMTRGFADWEPESLREWSELSRQADVVVDVGAYAGVYSCLAIASGASQVVAFEPNPMMLSQLRETISANGFGAAVDLRAVALADRTFGASAHLMIPGTRAKSSGVRLQTVAPDSDDEEWATGSLVPVTCLDEALSNYSNRVVTGIKMDAEGAELLILHGASGTLSKHKPRVLLESLNRGELDKIASFMRALGYDEGKALDGCDVRAESRPGAAPARNYLFLPPSIT